MKPAHGETGVVFLEKQENDEIGIFLPYIGGKIPPINRGFPPHKSENERAGKEL